MPVRFTAAMVVYGSGGAHFFGLAGRPQSQTNHSTEDDSHESRCIRIGCRR